MMFAVLLCWLMVTWYASKEHFLHSKCVRILPWLSCLSCPCSMFLCLFCVWAHGSVSVCVCHVLPLSHLPVSPGHAPLFSPCLVLVCLIVFTWSLCALLLYILFLSLVFAGSFWCLPVLGPEFILALALAVLILLKLLFVFLI